MPHEGFKTITIKQNTFYHLNDIWTKHKEALCAIGITSYSNLADVFLEELNNPIIRSDFIKRRHEKSNQAMKDYMKKYESNQD